MGDATRRPRDCTARLVGAAWGPSLTIAAIALWALSAASGEPAAPTAAARPHAAHAVEADGWYLLEPPEGLFRARLPAPPRAERRSRRTLVGRLHEALFEAQADGRRFAVEVYELPGGARWLFPDALILDRARASLLDDLRATALREAPIALGAEPGRSVLYRYLAGDEHIEEGRFYLVGSRLYVVVAGRRDAERLDPEARRFFESFRAWPAGEAPEPGRPRQPSAGDRP